MFNNLKDKCFFLIKLFFSLGNSNSLFLKNKFHFDMVRAGGFIYGLDLSKKKKVIMFYHLKQKLFKLKVLKKVEV